MAMTGPQNVNIPQLAEAELRQQAQDIENSRRRQNQNARNSQQQAQDEENAQQAAREEARDRAKGEIEERINAKKSLFNFYAPNLPNEGLMSKIEYQTQLTPEGMAGAILAEYFVFAVRLLFNTDYMRQTAEYNQLKSAGMFNLLYEPDEAGNYPTVYRVNPVSGDIDYDDPIPDGEANNFEVRMNGLVPIPSWKDGILAACDKYMGEILGQGGLSLEQKNRAYGLIERADNEIKSGRNLARDRAMVDAMRPRPIPRPRT